MDKIAKAIGLFLFGAAMHLFAPVIDKLPKGWGNLTRCAIGSLMCWIGILPFTNDYRDVPNPHTRITLRFFSGVLPMGIGVVFAYIWSHFQEVEE